jgi:hypothetical protein
MLRIAVEVFRMGGGGGGGFLNIFRPYILSAICETIKINYYMNVHIVSTVLCILNTHVLEEGFENYLPYNVLAVVRYLSNYMPKL